MLQVKGILDEQTSKRKVQLGIKRDIASKVGGYTSGHLISTYNKPVFTALKEMNTFAPKTAIYYILKSYKNM